jgi:tRNA threonylcarbamoyl adenosine modification protein (Sua5/YciO/YrdC/YwlC family)
VVLPTDTVYGIGALPRLPRAIDSVFRAKGRPEDKPLPVLGASAIDLAAVVEFDERAHDIAGRFWPGPLTLVLPRSQEFEVDLGGVAGAGVGVRVPACELALDLLGRVGPLAVTSANRSGEEPATTADEARRALSDAVEVVLDGGKRAGVPSTVLSLVDEPKIIRRGPLDDQIRRVVAVGRTRRR